MATSYFSPIPETQHRPLGLYNPAINQQSDGGLFGFLHNFIGGIGEAVGGIGTLIGAGFHDVGRGIGMALPGEQNWGVIEDTDPRGNLLPTVGAAMIGLNQTDPRTGEFHPGFHPSQSAIARDFGERYGAFLPGGRPASEGWSQLYEKPVSFLTDALTLAAGVGAAGKAASGAGLAGKIVSSLGVVDTEAVAANVAKAALVQDAASVIDTFGVESLSKIPRFIEGGLTSMDDLTKLRNEVAQSGGLSKFSAWATTPQVPIGSPISDELKLSRASTSPLTRGTFKLVQDRFLTQDVAALQEKLSGLKKAEEMGMASSTDVRTISELERKIQLFKNEGVTKLHSDRYAPLPLKWGFDVLLGRHMASFITEREDILKSLRGITDTIPDSLKPVMHNMIQGFDDGTLTAIPIDMLHESVVNKGFTDIADAGRAVLSDPEGSAILSYDEQAALLHHMAAGDIAVPGGHVYVAPADVRFLEGRAVWETQMRDAMEHINTPIEHQDAMVSMYDSMARAVFNNNPGVYGSIDDVYKSMDVSFEETAKGIDGLYQIVDKGEGLGNRGSVTYGIDKGKGGVYRLPDLNRLTSLARQAAEKFAAGETPENMRFWYEDGSASIFSTFQGTSVLPDLAAGGTRKISDAELMTNLIAATSVGMLPERNLELAIRIMQLFKEGKLTEDVLATLRDPEVMLGETGRGRSLVEGQAASAQATAIKDIFSGHTIERWDAEAEIGSARGLLGETAPAKTWKDIREAMASEAGLDDLLRRRQRDSAAQAARAGRAVPDKRLEDALLNLDSRQKVRAFYSNLMDDANRVTIDRRMGIFFGIYDPEKLFSLIDQPKVHKMLDGNYEVEGVEGTFKTKGLADKASDKLSRTRLTGLNNTLGEFKFKMGLGGQTYRDLESYVQDVTASLNASLEPGESPWLPRQTQAALWSVVKDYLDGETARLKRVLPRLRKTDPDQAARLEMELKVMDAANTTEVGDAAHYGMLLDAIFNSPEKAVYKESIARINSAMSEAFTSPDALAQRISGEVKGATVFGPDFKAALHFFRTGDLSTVIHEGGHWLRRRLPKEMQDILWDVYNDGKSKVRNPAEVLAQAPEDVGRIRRVDGGYEVIDTDGITNHFDTRKEAKSFADEIEKPEPARAKQDVGTRDKSVLLPGEDLKAGQTVTTKDGQTLTIENVGVNKHPDTNPWYVSIKGKTPEGETLYLAGTDIAGQADQAAATVEDVVAPALEAPVEEVAKKTPKSKSGPVTTPDPESIDQKIIDLREMGMEVSPELEAKMRAEAGAAPTPEPAAAPEVAAEVPTEPPAPTEPPVMPQDLGGQPELQAGKVWGRKMEEAFARDVERWVFGKVVASDVRLNPVFASIKAALADIWSQVKGVSRDYSLIDPKTEHVLDQYLGDFRDSMIDNVAQPWPGVPRRVRMLNVGNLADSWGRGEFVSQIQQFWSPTVESSDISAAAKGAVDVAKQLDPEYAQRLWGVFGRKRVARRVKTVGTLYQRMVENGGMAPTDVLGYRVKLDTWEQVNDAISNIDQAGFQVLGVDDSRALGSAGGMRGVVVKVVDKENPQMVAEIEVGTNMFHAARESTAVATSRLKRFNIDMAQLQTRSEELNQRILMGDNSAMDELDDVTQALQFTGRQVDAANRRLQGIWEPLTDEIDTQLLGSMISSVPGRDALANLRFWVARMEEKGLAKAPGAKGAWDELYLFDRQYLPMRIADGAEWDPKLKDFVGGRSSFELDDTQAAKGLPQPFYFPQIQPPGNLMDFLIGRKTNGMRRMAWDPHLSRNTGAMLKDDNYVTDVYKAYGHRASRALKMLDTYHLVDEITSTYGRRITSEEELLPGEKLFSPDGLLQFFSQSIGLEDRFWALASKLRQSGIESVGDLRRTGSEDVASIITEGIKNHVGLSDSDKVEAAALFQSVMDNVPATQRDIMGVTRRGVEMWAIPDIVAHRLEQSTIPKFGVKARLFWDTPTNLWRSLTLAGRPAWVLNNVVGNLVFAKFQGAKISDMLRQVGDPGFRDLTDEIATMVPGVDIGFWDMPQQYTSKLGYAGETRVGQIYDWMGASKAVQPFRAVGNWVKRFNNAAEDVARKASMIRGLDELDMTGARNVGSLFWTSKKGLQDVMLHGLDEASATKVLNSVNKAFGDFSKLSPMERQIIRRFIAPFYGFYRHSTLTLLRMPFEHPFKTQIVMALDDAREQLLAEQGPMPGWLEDATSLGGNDWLSTSGPNPFNVLSQSGLSLLHPFIKTSIETFTGRSTFTGRQFTDPNVFTPFGSEQQWRVVKGANGEPVDAYPINRVAPNFIEGLLSNIPQYSMLKDAIAGGNTYDTSTLPQVLANRVGFGQNQTVIDPNTGQVQKPYGYGDLLAKSFGVSSFTFDLGSYQSHYYDERQAALKQATEAYQAGML